LTKKLSVAIISKNESLSIAECIRSVAFADEVVVCDFGSIDDTVEIAIGLGCKVYKFDDWQGFGWAKNLAIGHCAGDWILSLDADERVTNDLAVELLAVTQSSEGLSDVFEIPRKSWFCGQFMNYSGWRPDFVGRLFKKGAAVFSSDLVHERLLYTGHSERLNNPLIHISFRDFDQVIEKMNRYSTASALNAVIRRPKRGGVRTAIAAGVWAFVRTYIFKRGFLDGRLGFALAVANAEGAYYRYIKLWFAFRTKEQAESPE
jgi:glycosyltransferase involved in cell wall biosynthesis